MYHIHCITARMLDRVAKSSIMALMIAITCVFCWASLSRATAFTATFDHQNVPRETFQQLMLRRQRLSGEFSHRLREPLRTTLLETVREMHQKFVHTDKASSSWTNPFNLAAPVHRLFAHESIQVLARTAQAKSAGSGLRHSSPQVSSSSSSPPQDKHRKTTINFWVRSHVLVVVGGTALLVVIAFVAYAAGAGLFRPKEADAAEGVAHEYIHDQDGGRRRSRRKSSNRASQGALSPIEELGERVVVITS